MNEDHLRSITTRMLRYLSEKQKATITPIFTAILLPPPKITNLLGRVAHRNDPTVTGSLFEELNNFLGRFSYRNELNTSSRTGQSYFHPVDPPETSNIALSIPLIQVEVGERISYVLSSAGKVYIHRKELGYHHFEALTEPEKIVRFYSQEQSFFMLSSTGKVWTLDDQAVIAIEFQERIVSIIPYNGPEKRVYFITASGNVFYLTRGQGFFGFQRWGKPVRVGRLQNIVSIVLTWHHKLFLSFDGKVYSEYQDRLSLVELPARIVKIVASSCAIALLITDKGRVYKLSRTRDRVVTEEAVEIKGMVVAVCVVNTFAAVLTCYGAVYIVSFRASYYGVYSVTCNGYEFTLQPYLGGAIKISGSKSNIMILLGNGKLYAFGEGLGGMLNAGLANQALYTPQLVNLRYFVTDLDATCEDSGIVIMSGRDCYRSIGRTCVPSFCYAKVEVYREPKERRYLILE